MNLTVLGRPARNEDAAAEARRFAEQVLVRPPGDRVLLAADCGIVALHANDLDTATRMLDEALGYVAAVTVGWEGDIRATQLTGAESEKLFKGEPHERVLMCLYRGIAFLAQGDVENAHACLVNASLQDAVAAERVDRGDWLAVDLIHLVCDRSMRNADADEFAERCRQRYAEELAEHPQLFDEVQRPLILVIGVGSGPQKRTAHQGKDVALTYVPRHSRVKSIEVRARDRPLPAPASEDIYVQAVTRGRRQMDALLSQKKKAQDTTDAIGTGLNIAARVGGAIVPGVSELGALIKELSMAQASKIQTAADIRELYTAPGRLYVSVLDRADVDGPLWIRLLAEDGTVVSEGRCDIDEQRAGPVIVTALARM